MTNLKASAFLCVTLLLPAGLAAQQDRSLMTRTQLEELLGERLRDSESPVYSQAIRNDAVRLANAIRTRLEQGDLRVGDRVLLVVQGQPLLSDTFNVIAGPVIDLPVVGIVELAGVLRSELDAHLKARIGQYFRDPDVRAQSLIRTAVLGGVRNPGFLAVPSGFLVQDAVSQAGGLAANAKIEDVYIRRGSERIWENEALRDAMRDGATLDQLNLVAGDEIVVPVNTGRGGAETVIRTMSIALSLPLAIFAVIQLF